VEQDRADRTAAPPGYQFELPLEHATEQRLIVLIPMDEIQGWKFKEFVACFEPNIVFDVKHFARFDLPGSNRLDAFHAFKSIGAEYRCDPLPWHEINPRLLIVEKDLFSKRILDPIVSKTEINSICYLLQNSGHVRLLSGYLEGWLSHESEHSWRIVEAH
jgi:hypothetical protein